MAEDLTIGRVARAAEVNVETIRYYQRRGLLDVPTKPANGRRRYSSNAVRRLRFIKRAQQLGFTLEEVRGLLRLEDGRSCQKTRLLAEEKLAVIEQCLAHLTRVRRLLKGLIAECKESKRIRSCPMIAALSARNAGESA
jgi:MerR family transcriptional regulator, mercuric resistance operon regulatory protein